jgi:hypothetical protein
LGAPAWTSFTPVLTQTGVVTKTVTYSKYTQIGKTIIFNFMLAATGAGSANAVVTVSLPVTAASGTSGLPIGSGNIVDASAVTNNPGIAVFNSTTTLAFLDATAATGGVRLGNTGTVFSAALAAADTVAAMVIYEAA